MSLINDALRRANSSQRQSDAPVPPMQPVEPPPSSPILPWAVLICGVGVLAVAAVLWFRSRPEDTKQVARNEAPSTLSSAVTTAAPASEPPATAASRQPSAAPEVPAAKTEVAAAAVQQPAANPIVTPEPVTPAQPTPPPVAVTPAPAEPKTPEVTVAATPTPAAIETKTPAASEVRQPQSSQAPRLQAIYYRLRKPTVVINGKTIGPGQSVDGVKVVSIQRTSVEVLQDGKYRTLTMD
jgi:hypothetical protein